MRKEMTSVELTALLRARAARLVGLIEIASDSSDGLGPTVIAHAVAMIFHAAIQLYGIECLDQHLDMLKLQYERGLKGLCLDCGQPTESEEHPYCLACWKKSETERADLGTTLAIAFRNLGKA